MRMRTTVLSRWFSPKVVGLTLAAACMGEFIAPAHALNIYGGSTDRNSRFLADSTTANPNFFGASYDLSGITVSGGAAVMISPHYYVTAWHVGQAASLSFVNTQGATITKTVVDSARMMTNGIGSDLRIGRLADADGITLADKIAHYSIIVQPESWYPGKDIFVYSTGNGNQAGINKVSYISTISFANNNSPTRDIAIYYGPTYQDEAGLASQDSGSPWGIIWNGQFTAGGAHMGVYPGSTDYNSVSSFLPYYVDQINAYMAQSGLGEQVTIQAIPEPGSLAVLTGATVLLLRRRNDRRVRGRYSRIENP